MKRDTQSFVRLRGRWQQKLFLSLQHFCRISAIRPVHFRTLNLALEELLSNAQMHGKALSARVSCGRRGSWLEVRVEDAGQPFDPSACLKPCTHLTCVSSSIGGWGLPLVGAYTSGVRYVRKHGYNTIWLWLQLGGRYAFPLHHRKRVSTGNMVVRSSRSDGGLARSRPGDVP